MLLEQREEWFYEYCDAFGVSNDTIYITESEEGLFTKIKKMIENLIKKIHDFLFGEKVKKLDMNEKVKVPKDDVKKVNKFLKAYHTFVSKAKEFIKNHKVISVATITLLTSFAVGELRRRKDSKAAFGTYKRSELKKMAEQLEKDTERLRSEVSSADEDMVIQSTAAAGQAGLKAAQSTTGYALNTIGIILGIAIALTPIILVWVCIRAVARI